MTRLPRAIRSWTPLWAVFLSAPYAAAQLSSAPPERPGWYVTPWFRSAAVHEDNVLFTTSPTVESWLLRLTPGVEANFLRGAKSFQAGYTLDAERYPERLSSLDDVLARQEAQAEFRTLLGRRSSIQIRGAFLSTTRPEEVLADSGLLSLRRRSRSVAANARFVRELTRRASFNAGYVFSIRDFEQPEELNPKIGGVMHSVTTGVSYRHRPRSESVVDYTMRLFIQEEIAPDLISERDFASHVVAYRFSHELSRKWGFATAVGPRFSQALVLTGEPAAPTRRVDDLSAELLAELRFRGKEGTLDLRYAKSQYQAFGLAGFVDTDSFVAGVLWTPSVRFRIEANPGYYRNTRAGVTTNGVQFDFTTGYDLTPFLTLDAGYVFQYQDRLLGFVDGRPEVVDEPTRRNTFRFGITLKKTYDAN